MLPKIAGLKSNSSNRRCWSLLLGGLALLAVPTWYVQAQPPAVADPAKAQPDVSARTTPDYKPIAPKSPTKPEIKKPVASIPPAAVLRPPLPAMARPSVEFLPEPSEVEVQILEKLKEQVEFEFQEESLAGLVEYLHERFGLQCVIDRIPLEDESIAIDTTDITLKVSGISLRSALNLLLKPKQLAFIVEDEVIKITTRTHAQSLFTTRTYPVRDLVGNVEGEYELLTLAIQEGVGGLPDYAWLDQDGEGGTISRLPASGALVIRQTAKAHDEILQLLRSLRQANEEIKPKTSQVAPVSETRVAGPQVDWQLVNYHVSDARVYPLVGPARLAKAHFKCTVKSDQAADVAYVDASHLIQTN